MKRFVPLALLPLLLVAVAWSIWSARVQRSHADATPRLSVDVCWPWAWGNKPTAIAWTVSKEWSPPAPGAAVTPPNAKTHDGWLFDKYASVVGADGARVQVRYGNDVPRHTRLATAMWSPHSEGFRYIGTVDTDASGVVWLGVDLCRLAVAAPPPAQAPAPSAPAAPPAQPAAPTAPAPSVAPPATAAPPAAAQAPETGWPAGTEVVAVVRVVDGDTIDVRFANSQTARVRLIGVDTPEVVDPRQPVQCFGREASQYAQQLLNGQTVGLEGDPSQGDRDAYGRLLRYVWLRDGRLFNLQTIAAGYAHEYTFNLPYKYQAQFKEVERRAREAQIGLWSPANCQQAAQVVAPAPVAPAPAPTQSPPSQPAPPAPAPRANPPTPQGGNVSCNEYDSVQVCAWVSNVAPGRSGNVTVYGRLYADGVPQAGASMHSIWRYRTTSSSCSGQTGFDGIAQCTRSVGGATTGYAVQVNVTLSHGGREYSAQTYFIPR